jgi:hypothetical protein
MSTKLNSLHKMQTLHMFYADAFSSVKRVAVLLPLFFFLTCPAKPLCSGNKWSLWTLGFLGHAAPVAKTLCWVLSSGVVVVVEAVDESLNP